MRLKTRSPSKFTELLKSRNQKEVQAGGSDNDDDYEDSLHRAATSGTPQPRYRDYSR